MAKATHTPLIAQYLEIRQQYPDAMLFFQVGDFYELFFDDAITAAEYLAITLTKRGKSNGTDIPLCGVPVHALSHYLIKLVKGGYTVALCEQLSKPQPGTVVKRAVTKVYTPGTLTEDQLLDEKSASYLCTLFTLASGTQRGLLFTELLTGHSVATVIDARNDRLLETELARFSPDEVVLVPAGTEREQGLLKKWGYVATPLREHADQAPLTAHDLLTDSQSDQWISTQFSEATQQQLVSERALLGAVELLYRYLSRNYPVSLEQLTACAVYEAESYVQLDAATLRNLAVIKNQENSSSHTLFSVMDSAQTAMGSRLLKKWLVRPLREKSSIERRQAVVAHFASHVTLLSQLKESLRRIGDLERIVGRIALGRATLADFIALRTTLENSAPLKQLLAGSSVPLLAQIITTFPDTTDLVALLHAALDVDASSEYLIRPGFSEQLDQLRDLATNGQAKIQELAVREGATHDISSLKILYTSVAGYFIEVTKTHLDKVPEHYRQVQTLANRARFITTELKELEQTLASAQEQVDSVEKELYRHVQEQVSAWVPQLRRLATSLAMLDGLYAFGHVAYTHSYVAPTFNDDGLLSITKGRHPVVEQSLNEPFIANDTALGGDASLWIVTGPNMGGKSTYLRQVALICLLAQCGSFVPADAANLALVDRIFTRIGAGDNVAQGKSTFLVEMEETATICGQATKDSLVILDEVGRGTSTEDGRALAHAIIEYLAQSVQSRTLFATHYHELTQLAQSAHSIANYHVECHKKGDTLHFLHTLSPGVAQASFGIEVAKLAHLPKSVISRARQLLEQPAFTPAQGVPNAPSEQHDDVSSLQEQHPVLSELSALDLDELSPRAAFEALSRLQSRL